MDLRQIRYVLALARYGTAQTFHMDQSVVSQKTCDLEAELGIQLFERHSGGVRLNRNTRRRTMASRLT